MSEVSAPIPPSYVIEGHSGSREWRRTVTLVKHLTRRQLALRYRGSAFGFFWSLVNPIMMMVVYTFVFKYVLRIAVPGVPYPVFFLTGILAWNFLQIATMNSAVCIVDNHSLISKAYFPRVVLPLSAVASNMVNYLVSLPVLLVFTLYFGIYPTKSLLLLPLALLVLATLALGIGLITAAITPFFRDLLQILELFFMAWFFASPVLYPATLPQQNLPAKAYALYQLNPVVGVQSLVRSAFLGQPMDGTAVLVSLVIGLVLLAVGWWWFHRVAPRFSTAI